MENETLANLVGATLEGEPAFQDDTEGKETPPAPPAEEKTEDEEEDSGAEPASEGEKAEEATDEEKKPLHKDKRFRQVIAERNEARLQAQEYAKRIDELESLKREVETLKGSAQPQIPDWFTESFGENPHLWAKYQAYEEKRFASIQEAAERKAQEAAKAEREENAKWDKWVKTRLDELESEGLEFDRNRLLKIAIDYAPSDDEGNVDFRKAYQLMTALDSAPKAAKSEARKRLAAGTAPSGSEAPDRDFMTDEDMRKIRWGSITT